MTRVRGRVEAELAVFINRFEREHMGRGAVETRAFLIEDMLLIRLRGVLTPAEQQLAKEETGSRGRDLIKQVRLELLNRAQPMLTAGVQNIVGVAVRSMHVDISVRTGEKVIVFTLEGPPPVSS